MPTLDEIKLQLNNIGGLEKFFGRREIKELPAILWDNEKVENIIQGVYNNGMGILVATNKRLVFVDKGMLFGLKVEDFGFDKISSIQYETGLIFGKLIIFTAGNKALIEQVDKKKVRVFGDAVRAKISNRTPEPAAQVVNINNTSNDDLITRLEKLGKLKEAGILTDEEFLAQKNKLLNASA